MKMRITLIWFVPAFSFSKKSVMARGPKYGVAFRHDLIKTHEITALEDIGKMIPKSVLEISSGNAVWVIGRWSKSYGEIAKGDIVELLSNGKPKLHVPGRMDHLNIRLHVKF